MARVNATSFRHDTERKDRTMGFDIDSLTVAELKQITALAQGVGACKPAKKSSPMIGHFVLVRTYSAGVHVGTLTSKSGRDVTLADARRVWRWKGANSLSELSQKGAEETYTRISELVPVIALTEAVEIIPCSEAGKANLSKSRWGA